MFLRRKFKRYGLFIYITSIAIFIFLITKLQYCLHNQSQNIYNKFHPKYQPRLAIIVPFRDRYEELKIFVPHIHKFLAGKVPFKIYIINQNDSYRFNRAALINIGYLMSKSDGYNYMAMHDVDLMPQNPKIHYSYPEGNTVLHLTPSGIHPRYSYPTFIGGILILSHRLFGQVDGMSNNFWGWGREDDEFYMRLKELNVTIIKPQNITTGTHTFIHYHDKEVRKRDMKMSQEQYKAAFERDHTSGLSTIKRFYNIISTQNTPVDGYDCQFISVRLNCNITLTPWCL